MERNIGKLDARLRILVGIGFLVLAAILNQRPFLALGSAVIALLLIGTAVTGVCPLYTALDWRTRGTPPTTTRA